MNIRSDIRSAGTGQQEHPPHKPGLWKLLVAAIVILFAMVGAMEIFGGAEEETFSSPPSAATEGR
jgi:hypothetical protein